MNERIKKLRKALDLTQQKFADKLCIKRNTVATYETGKSNPSDAAVVLICKTFNVSETWLRIGEGEMFVELPRNEALAAQIQAFLQGGTDSFRERLVSMLLRLAPEQWDVLESYLVELVKERPAPVVDAKTATTTPAPDTPGQERTELDLAAKVAELERQNQELASEIAALKEEELAADFREAFSALQSGLAGSSDPAKRAKR